MLKNLTAAVLAAAAGVAAFGPVARAANEVDLELVLAVDVSRSMDYDEQTVQRSGYVNAFRDPELLKEIQSGDYGRIAVTYVEWSSSYYQQILVPWTVIATQADATAFANALAKAPINTDSRTSISSALLFAQNYFHMAPVTSDRRTIDVSGDGSNNDGVPLAPVRDQLVTNGITINGLPILIHPSNTFGPYGAIPLDDYYKACVTGGPSSFVIPIQKIDEFEAAIRRKLILEVASVPSKVLPADDLAVPAPSVNCAAAELQGGGGGGFGNPFFSP